MGNPTNDGAWSYTWEHGRQLKQMTSGTTTLTFLYNHEGLRVRKQSQGNNTYITYHGGNVIYQSDDQENYLYFFYDAQNRVSLIRYNWAVYGVIYNLQGDVSRRAQWAKQAGGVPVSHRAQRAAARCATMAN